MNCEDLQRELPDVIDGCRTTEQQLHLRSCRECSGLLADLELISREARLLQASEEPSPRVWDAIEKTLREEGLIHEPGPQPVLSFPRRWNSGWMLPLAAAFLITIAVVRYRIPAAAPQMADRPSVPMVTASLQSPVNTPASAEDEQLLAAVGAKAPALRASYEADLKDVNAYIRDAEESAHSNPNDEEEQRYLMDAYEQKAMVYDMALNRSLP
jgi:hypothetical protein